MLEPVDPRLDEAILEDLTVIEPRRVLADFLEGHGHPRAELIRLQIDERDPKEWLARHADFTGDLKGVGETWRLGFVDTLSVYGGPGVGDETPWPVIATHRSYRFLRELSILRNMHFDPSWPPPDGIRRLRMFPYDSLVQSLATVTLPRVKTLVIENYSQSDPPRLDGKLLADSLHAVPALEELELAKCLDEASISILVARLAGSPLREQLRTLKVDRFTESAAASLIDAGMKVSLVTERETIGVKTTARLRGTVSSWKRGTQNQSANTATQSPMRAPAGYVEMPPVTQIADQHGWVTEWAGSGVAIFEHPGVAGSAECASCHGTNTMVIWGRIEYWQTAWGPDQCATDYELVCRACGRFTLHAHYR